MQSNSSSDATMGNQHSGNNDPNAIVVYQENVCCGGEGFPAQSFDGRLALAGITQIEWSNMITEINTGLKIAQGKCCKFVGILVCCLIVGSVGLSFYVPPFQECSTRPCEDGEDPSVDACCRYWCCANGQVDKCVPEDSSPGENVWSDWAQCEDTYRGYANTSHEYEWPSDGQSETLCFEYEESTSYECNSRTDPTDCNTDKNGNESCERLSDDLFIEGYSTDDPGVVWPLIVFVPIVVLGCAINCGCICSIRCKMQEAVRNAFDASQVKAKGIEMYYFPGRKGHQAYIRFTLPGGAQRMMAMPAGGAGGQMVQVQIPPDAQLGSSMTVQFGAMEWQVQVPQGAAPGNTITVQAPAQQVQVQRSRITKEQC